MIGSRSAEEVVEFSEGELLIAVEERLGTFFAESIERAAGFGTAAPQLWTALREAASGGKRHRPRLLMSSYVELGGRDLAAAAAVAAAYELLHTALLIHDDVIDRDWTRRGTPNVAGRYRDRAMLRSSSRAAAHYGRSAAILAGDLALASAPRFVESAVEDPSTRARLLQVFYDAVLASVAGEVSDLELATTEDAGPPTIEQILGMERAKTSVYSFEAPLMSGAILAGAGLDVVLTLGEYGREIGLAYQIVDDVLGVFGDEGATGKSSLGDLREGKWTVLIAHAAQTAEWEDLARLVGRPDFDAEHAAHAREILIRTGARDCALDLAGECASRARRALGGLPTGLQVRLDGIATLLVDRVR